MGLVRGGDLPRRILGWRLPRWGLGYCFGGGHRLDRATVGWVGRRCGWLLGRLGFGLCWWRGKGWHSVAVHRFGQEPDR
jgi:hypothetical protein